MTRAEEIAEEARAVFATRDVMEAQLRALDNRLKDLRSEYRQETRTFINDMARFRNAVHTAKIAA